MTVSERVRNMLLKDKLDLGEGYMRAFKSDIDRLLGYYMMPCGECEVVITPSVDGFTVAIKASASRLKRIEAV